jgi:hypothetical protein
MEGGEAQVDSAHSLDHADAKRDDRTQQAHRAQCWSFGPSGTEYFLRWDGAPTRNELSKALKSGGASTVRLSGGSGSGHDGRPGVGRATFTTAGKRGADETKRPQPKEKRSKLNSHAVDTETAAAANQQ